MGAEHHGGPAQIGVTAANGVVTLTGTVATHAEKCAAEKAAQRVEGVKGLAEEITIKPYGGNVTLSGSVRSWGEKDQARAAAWNAPGVDSVTNDIAVSYT